MIATSHKYLSDNVPTDLAAGNAVEPMSLPKNKLATQNRGSGKRNLSSRTYTTLLLFYTFDSHGPADVL
jgi:hypothetical protein